MITFTASDTDTELSGIIDLQRRNLPQNLAENERQSQGFVTVCHTLADLKMMSRYENHLIVKDDETVIGYLLAMTKHSKNDIPILIPMFDLFNHITYKQKPISAYNYLVIGQVCIAKDYRGLGLLDESYKAYKARFQEKYDFAITEIALNNPRSINAHKRIGFIELHRYTDTNKIDWSVVIWDWR